MSRITDDPISTQITAKGFTPQSPEPEMLGRNDNTGKDKRWNITGVEAKRGEPKTNVTDREMFVPLYDDEHSRTIRGHEMVHAKVSPNAKQFDKWIARGYAKQVTMTVCEELRVNMLLEHSGFDPQTYLRDGSERLDGERTAQHGDFLNAVATCIAYRNTGGYGDYLAGISKHHPEWVEYLSYITDKGVEYYNNIVKTHGVHTLGGTHSRIHLSGFGYVENYAKWVEEVVGALTDNASGQPQGQPAGEGTEATDPKEALEKSGQSWIDANKGWNARGSIPKKSRDALWETLKVSTPMLDRNVMGALGRKRIATNMGRNPRRMSRLLTDPEKRIFDRTVKGAGGVVLIDTSGSMSLSHDEVMEMVLNAPSALVAQYSGGRTNKPNLYVVANKGKCVSTLPNPNGGNGVDAPAIRWAVGKRQRSNSPLIWVTDGGVTGKGDAWGADLVMECIALIKKFGIYTAETPEQAIAMLKAMTKGEKVRSIVPSHLAGVYLERTGHTLTYR